MFYTWPIKKYAFQVAADIGETIMSAALIGLRTRSGRAASHPDRILLLELLEAGFHLRDVPIELREKHILQRARATRSAFVLQVQPFEIAARCGNLRCLLQQRDIRLTASLRLGGDV